MRITDLKKYMDDIEFEADSAARAIARLKKQDSMPDWNQEEKMRAIAAFRGQLSAIFLMANIFERTILVYSAYNRERKEFTVFIEKLKKKIKRYATV